MGKTDFLLKQVRVLGAEFQRIQWCFKSVLMACGVFLLCVKVNYYSP